MSSFFPHQIKSVLIVLAATIVMAAPLSAGVSGSTVVDFGNGFDITKLSAHDVLLSPGRTSGKPTLRIESHHNDQWPGVVFTAPAKYWDLTPYEYMAVDVRNLGTNDVTVCCRVDNDGADGVKNCITSSITLKPNEKGTLTINLQRKVLDVKLFGMRGYPYQAGQPIDPSKINQMIIFVGRPTADHLFEVSNIRAGGVYHKPAFLSSNTPFMPFIDTFGQFIHEEWPGKVHSVNDLVAHGKAEQAELKHKPGPSDWDKYGGWQNGPSFAATGYFRTVKYSGKWWLVDPDGKLFFSNGVDCVNSRDYTPIDDRADWFKDFPGYQPEFAEFMVKAYAIMDYYKGKTPMNFSFALANAKRKYGAGWKLKSAEVAHLRLRSWGMNTIGNWSSSDVFTMRKTPYVAGLYYQDQTKMIEGSEGYWGKFPDVFDPSFAESLHSRMAEEVGHAAGDPWCLGYFVDNEMAWGDETSLSIGVLLSPADQAAKKVFITDLKAKYVTIDQLNQAWGTSYQSWDALLNAREAPDKQKAHDDLTAFYTRIAEQYFRTIKATIKKVAPNQLYLGCRFAWTNPLAIRAAAKYCDVLSFNLYMRSISEAPIPADITGPILIGEFHFGATDRGSFHPGLVPVKGQKERSRSYEDYVHGVLKDPRFIGCHWFQYYDEPTTGRGFDGENYNVGLVDVADTPYPEMVDAIREVGYTMYDYRMKN
jgi:hypothetical protein